MIRLICQCKWMNILYECLAEVFSNGNDLDPIHACVSEW